MGGKQTSSAEADLCYGGGVSDRKDAKLDQLRDAQRRSSAVVLIFIGIDSPALSEIRVQGRVANGGHDV
jgi:predicted ABC-type ATPase